MISSSSSALAMSWGKWCEDASNFKKAENNFINRPTLIIFGKFWDSHIRQKRYERDIK